ncbi:MAG: ROK family protein [Rhodobacteraceae bacterium]|nr:ROK family protein [Paracoccaceae bacterium]
MNALVIDIGGTNTRVALASGPAIVPGSVRRYRNAEHAGLDAVLARYLSDAGTPPIQSACAALAGPVRDGRGRLTNLDWTIDEADIARVTGARRVRLINDLQAQGYALDHLSPGALIPVLHGPQVRGGARLVIGIGTGFNAAAVHAGPTGTLVTAAEAGHSTLPVSDEAGLSLARFAAGADGFAAVEDILSGRGLEHAFGWITSQAGSPRTMAAHSIVERAATDPDAAQALRLFADMLGVVAGDLALNHLPFGGLFLTGGVARAVTPYLDAPGFAASFRAKGRFAPLMAEFAVHTVTDDFAALTGCAGYLAGQG